MLPIKTRGCTAADLPGHAVTNLIKAGFCSVREAPTGVSWITCKVGNWLKLELRVRGTHGKCVHVFIIKLIYFYSQYLLFQPFCTGIQKKPHWTIKRSDLLSCKYREIHKISPPHLTHPGWHLLSTHMHRVTHQLRQMPLIDDRSGGQPFTAPGEHEGTVPCSRAPQSWQGGGLPPLQLSFHQSLSGEWNRLTTHSKHWSMAASETNQGKADFGRSTC